jgi:hypothetical protein
MQRCVGLLGSELVLFLPLELGQLGLGTWELGIGSWELGDGCL